MRISLQVVGGLPRQPEIVEIDGQAWRLEGECNQCGDCCNQAGTPFPKADGLGCEKVKRNLDEQMVETFECTIYWTRPWSCAMWPRDPAEPLPLRCSLKWHRLVGTAC